MPQAKKLIEVAMPVKEISAESVRDKSIRHGHISTLHLWWARRPLPVCRAVVFASLVPDPLDEHCPDAFKETVEVLLGKQNNPGDPYKPYDDIPYTSVHDPMEDNLRNRLQMFIGKFSEDFISARKSNRPDPPVGRLLSDHSLIKWDNKNNEAIINKARKLIWVAHNAKNGSSANALLESFDKHFESIRQAENDLYSTSDRHISSAAINKKEEKLHQAIEAFLDYMPRVFDPFAGGGAIPLEAARLGCRSYGNDLNPVAHIIQKGSVEFPQKYGKPITYSAQAFTERYGRDTLEKWCLENMSSPDDQELMIEIHNRLAFDVEFFAKKLLALAEKEIGQYYPADEKGNKPIAYYWARVGTCSNPSCRAEVPLLKGFYLANTKNKKVYLKPVINGNKIDFEVRKGATDETGWTSRGNLTCPCCGSLTDVRVLKQQFLEKISKERLLAVIWKGENGKEYKLPRKRDFDIVQTIPKEAERPSERMPVTYTQALPSCTWGLQTWGQMFSLRQLLAMQTLVAKLQEIKKELKPEESEYAKAVVTYLGIWIDRVAIVNTSYGRWDVTRENIQSPFSKQAIPMVFDFPESNFSSKSTGGADNHLNWILRFICSECTHSFFAESKNASSGDRNQFDYKSLTAVVTDPPYYDAIAYADLSDFFYVWLKRTLSDLYPINFATPQTPKSDECTALKHHHGNQIAAAKLHFEQKLTSIFNAIEYQTSDIISIMFAHQSTEAWTTLCNSILGANMNITGSWPIDTEMANRSLGLAGAVLASSVTVSARPARKEGLGSYKDVKNSIHTKVAEEVDELYQLGFRGADLLTACFGQAVSVFGQYQTVEKADGSEVTVAELLEMARESAFNALLKGFSGDEFTRFYIGWLQLYGFTESDFDDAAKFSRVGLSINVSELFSKSILIRNGNKQTLAGFEERLTLNPNLGERGDLLLIDKVHRAMALYKGTNRNSLLSYLAEAAPSAENSFWRVVTSLCEVLPAGSDDSKQANGLLANKESLLRDARTLQASKPEQKKLFE
jgi:putative DNA methylase